jgi:hypothetical protein
MHTSVSLLITTMVIGQATAPPSTPVWQKSYSEARELTQASKKPMAIFIAPGPAGAKQAITEGALTDTLQKVLATKYVCVYLDTNNSTHQSLIEALRIRGGFGVVVSDHTGGLMAFHHDGKISQANLQSHLDYFADSAVQVKTTISNTTNTARPSYYGPVNGVAPANYVAPAAPAPVICNH